jgi:hypothetical protein
MGQDLSQKFVINYFQKILVLKQGFISSWEVEMAGANMVGICLKPTDASIEDGEVR